MSTNRNTFKINCKSLKGLQAVPSLNVIQLNEVNFNSYFSYSYKNEEIYQALEQISTEERDADYTAYISTTEHLGVIMIGAFFRNTNDLARFIIDLTEHLEVHQLPF